MKVNIILSDEEKQTLKASFDIINSYRKLTTETGNDYIKLLCLNNYMTDFLNRVECL